MKILTISISELLLAGMAIGIGPSLRAATIIYDDLGATVGGIDQVLPLGPLDDSFTPSTTAEITGLQLALASYGGPGTLTVGLYSGTQWGDLIATLGTIDVSTITSVVQDYSVSLLAHPTVMAGTRYWIGATTRDSWNVTWAWASDASGVGVSGEYWAFDGVINYRPGPYLMKLEVSQVPDLTSTACVLALSMSGLILKSRITVWQ